MRVTRIAIILGLALVLLASFALAGCSSSDADDAETSEAESNSTESEGADDASTTDEDAEGEDSDSSADGSGDDTAAFVGTWENSDGSVFRVITFNGDGTANVTTYADLKTDATWSLEDGYLRVETVDGEAWGNSVVWVSETEWDWAYEDGTWTQAE